MDETVKNRDAHSFKMTADTTKTLTDGIWIDWRMFWRHTKYD